MCQDHVQHVGLKQDPPVISGQHLLEGLGCVEVCHVADDASYANVEIGEVLKEAEAKCGCVGEAVNVDLSLHI